MADGFQIAGKQQVFDIIEEQAGHILLQEGTGIRLLGIRRRGVPIAEQIAESMEEQSGVAVATGEMTLKRYADDLSLLHQSPELLEAPDLQIEEDDRILLIDDVMYSGRTLFRAAGVVSQASPAVIRTSVLCLRGGRERPIHIDFPGRHYEVPDDTVIEVHAPPYEDEWGIYLVKKEDLQEG